MNSIIPSKDSVILGATTAGKFFSTVTGLSAYAGYIPAKYVGLAFLLFTIASSFKDISAAILAVVRGDKITLSPPAPAQPVPKS